MANKRKHQNGSCPYYVEWLIWPVLLICSLRLSLSPSIIYPAGHFELKGARFWNNSSGLVGASLSVISWQEFFHHFLFSSKAKNSSENSIWNDDTKTGTLLVSWKGNWRPCQRKKASSVWVRLVDPKVSKLFTIFIWFLFFFFTHYTHELHMHCRIGQHTCVFVYPCHIYRLQRLTYMGLWAISCAYIVCTIKTNNFRRINPMENVWIFIDDVYTQVSYSVCAGYARLLLSIYNYALRYMQ